jgi:hypothetical protein
MEGIDLHTDTLTEIALPECRKARYNIAVWHFRTFYRRYAKNYTEKIGLLTFYDQSTSKK